MCLGYNCCVSKSCSACCTIWCAFGTVILFFFYMLGHYDAPCNQTLGVCNGNYFLTDFTDPNITSQQAGDICGMSAIGYLICSIVCGGFWVYHDYMKKTVKKKKGLADEVEFQDLGASLLDEGEETTKAEI